MRTVTLFLLAGVMTCLGAACGSNEPSNQPDEKAQEAVSEARGASQPQAKLPVQQMAQGLQQMAQGFQQLATDPQNATVKPVHFRELKKLFPEFSGWTRADTSGQMMNMPVPFSQAEATYTKGGARIKVSIVDSTMSQMLLAPFTMLVAAGFERESDTGYERGGTVAGNPTWEKWRSDTKSGEFSMLVAKRYLVKLEGSHLDNLEPLKQLAAKFDFSKIEQSSSEPTTL